MAALAPTLAMADPTTTPADRRFRLGRKAAWTALWLAMGAAAAYFLAPQAQALGASIKALGRVNPMWMALGIAVVAARYAAAAFSLNAATGTRLPFVPTVMVQLSTSFVGRLTPEGIGWFVLNQRYLEMFGLARTSAAAALTLRIAAGAIVRIVIIALVAFLLGRSALSNLALPTAWPFILAGLGVAAVLLAGIGYALRARAPRLVAALRTGAIGIAVTLRSPGRSAVLFGASAAVTVSYVLTLAISVAAFGEHLSFLELFGMYLAATTVAAASPTPGNLGALELALTAGLTGLGLEAGTALAAVLIFRLLTFWLPLLPGFLAFRYLQHRKHI